MNEPLTAEELVVLSSQLPDTGAVALTCPFEPLAVAAGQQLGRHINTGDGVFDVRIALPEAAAWTVGEITESISSVVSKKPVERHVMVIGAANHLGQQGTDRLLKTIEEPTARTLWLLCCRDIEELSVTLQSRIVHQLAVPVTAPAELLTKLDGTGIDPNQTAQSLASILDLVDTLVGHEPFPAFVQALDAVQRDPSPVTVNDVCAAMKKVATAAKLSTGDSRRLAAGVCTAAVDAWRDMALQLVRDGLAPDVALTAQTACDDAVVAVRRYGPLPVHLTAASIVVAGLRGAATKTG